LPGNGETDLTIYFLAFQQRDRVRPSREPDGVHAEGPGEPAREFAQRQERAETQGDGAEDRGQVQVRPKATACADRLCYYFHALKQFFEELHYVEHVGASSCAFGLQFHVTIVPQHR
jgi:hypothetical protein